MDSNHVPGLALGIVQDGQVVYAEGFGVARVDTDQPVTPQSVFQIADQTHTFTALAALQLAEQGKLELDAPVVEYLPYFRLADERCSQITVKHLLTQMAGLPPTPYWAPNLDWEGKTVQTDDGALERYVHSLGDVQLHSDPGTRFVYCNMSYDIAGDVIAKVSGQLFEEYMAQHILAPLGMDHSTFYPEQVDPALRVTPHVYAAGERKVAVCELATHSRERAPSVGLFTTVADLSRWVMVHLNRGELDGTRILQSAGYDLLWEPVAELPKDWGNHYQFFALGWFLGANRSHPVRHYWGGDLGFHNSVYLVPDRMAGVVALGNQFTPQTNPVAYAETIAVIAAELVALS
jgi:CubicO group peptidase (beta-lactamase class C family)